MPINTISQFRFNQFYFQDNGGWCGGISTAVITHLYENLGDGYTYISPINAYNQIKEYARLLAASYNKITGQVAPGMAPLRTSIRALQAPFNIPEMLFSASGRPTGTYEYNFSEPGTAHLGLLVRDPPNTDYGSDFLSSFSSETANHAGVAVWTPARDIFLFDPNCGGLLFHWDICAQTPTFAAAIDLALAHMYAGLDRMRGARSAKLTSAKRLDLTNLPFGHV